MSPNNRPASFHAVKFLPLLAFAFLTGCQTYSGSQTYTKLSVSNHQGDHISEWIAEGYVSKTEHGYSIKAIERHSGAPNKVVNRYPNGWRTTVIGPNIVRQPVDKPAWLVELDAEKK